MRRPNLVIPHLTAIGHPFRWSDGYRQRIAAACAHFQPEAWEWNRHRWY
jgi:hypothetical protein